MSTRGDCICERLAPVDDANRCAACPKRRPRPFLGHRSFHVPMRGAVRCPEVAIVLVAGNADDYAAYMGIGDPAWVAEHGCKLAFDDAAAIFPGLDRARYRQ